jgi:hypothetical protein
MIKTSEEILANPTTKKTILENYQGIGNILNSYAKTVNYKTNIYYHVTGGYGEYGVGQGLYLGKDWQVLQNFYNPDNFGDVDMYKGSPNFLDLIEETSFNFFEKKAEKEFGKLPKNEHFKKLCLKYNFDGIRYFDIYATGEEFVLYVLKKVKFIKKIYKGSKIETFI